MPPVHKPLRVRCNINISVITNIETPFIGHFQARRALGTIDDQSTEFLKTIIPHQSPIGAQPPAVYNLHALHEFVPQLFIAFARGAMPPTVTPPPAVYFTHFVSIAYAAAGMEYGQANMVANKEEGIHILQLTIPRLAVGGLRVTSLTARQLMIARDFVSLALPYYSEAHPYQQYCGTRDHVRLLISAPDGDGGAIDIMSVVICYLTFASEESIANVMDCVEDEAERMAPEWKNVVQRGIGGLQIIERASTLGL
ncbi:hypothetical protein BD779DRAFT_1471370 [Infundibulicybe gibba]|nr:hypothetical protein BD779DRAFT_1471370 [Infundibulicybe gibba]